jgi:hypothetical protein
MADVDDLEVIRELLSGEPPSEDVSNYVKARLTAVIAAGESRQGARRPARGGPRSYRSVAGVIGRRLVLCSVAGVAALAAGAVIAVVALQTGPGMQQAQTAAYVVSRTKSALAAAGSHDLVESTLVTTSGGLRIEFLNGGALVTVADLRSQGSTSVAGWVYREQDKFASYTGDGQLTSVAGITAARHRMTTTSVDYQHGTWWRRIWPAQLPLAPEPEPGCGALNFAGPDILGLGGGQAAALRTALNCGDYTMAGTHVVDGVEALELRQIPSAASQSQLTFWVDPASYLPVRCVVTSHVPGMTGRIQANYRWLAPTPANVAELDITIPPGFTHASAP